MRCSVTLMCFCSEALQVSHKRTKNPQGQINTTEKEHCNTMALYRTHFSYPEAQGQFQQVTDNAKKNCLVRSSSIKSSTISSLVKYVSLAIKPVVFCKQYQDVKEIKSHQQASHQSWRTNVTYTKKQISK